MTSMVISDNLSSIIRVLHIERSITTEGPITKQLLVCRLMLVPEIKYTGQANLFN